jgi:VanZ family protein
MTSIDVKSRLQNKVRRAVIAYRRLPSLARWGAVALWMGLIYVLSAQPGLPSAPAPLLDLVLKKLGHMIEYAILTLLLQGALPSRSLAAAWALAVMYAVSDEYHQTFVPGRNGWFGDVIIDAAGAYAAVLGVRTFRRFR